MMKCENCEHWKYESYDFGYCDKTEVEESTYYVDRTEGRKDIIVATPDNWYVEVYTGKDFGCIHFLKKDEK